MAIYISSGIVEDGVSVWSGNPMIVLDGGTVENTRVTSNGSMTVSGGGSANGTTIDARGCMYVSSGGTATRTTADYAKIFVYEGASIFDTELNSWGVLSAMGEVHRTTINSDGSMHISSGGVAIGTVVNAGGELIVSSGGMATDTVINSGGFIRTAETDWPYVSGGSMTRTAINSGGVLLISRGGAAANTTVSDGGQFVVSFGTATATTVFSGGIVNGFTVQEQNEYANGLHISNAVVTSGWEAELEGKEQTASNIYVHAGGSVLLDGGSEISEVTVDEGGYLDVFDGTAEQILIQSGGRGEVGFYGVLRAATVRNNGSLLVSGYSPVNSDHTASCVYSTVSSGGIITVADGGTANSTTVSSGGCLTLQDGGTANVTVLHSGGDMRLCNGAILKGETSVGGKVIVEDGILAYGAKINYLVSERTTSDESIITDLGMIMEAIYFITVADAQQSGTYCLADGAEDFTDSITVKNTANQELGVLFVGQTLQENGVSYFLNLTGDQLTLTVSGAASDTEAPSITQIVANTTAPTNQNVMVTAVFADNVALTSKQYRLGSGNWLDYTGAITVTANTTVYFKAIDTAGNETNTQYVVSNIDKVAPTITQIKTNTTAATNQDVTVTATFADNVALALKQYKIGDGSWQNYTSGITMTANGTVYFKAVDTAGNEATVQYVVSNIDEIAPDAPVLSVTPLNRTNGTVTVTATFASDVVKKEYSLDGRNWQAYTKAVEVTANTTIHVRGYDEAGNASNAEYKITNIVQLDAEGPGTVILTPKVSKYNVTVKWTKPATQNKAKITGYEVEYNGKISIVKGTSLSLKNVAVSTGNTVQVRAIDSLGRYGALSSVVAFDVKDVTAPTLGKITAAIDDYTGTIAWSGSDNVGIVKYVVTCAGQSQTVTSGTSAKFDHFAIGKYRATVQAFDTAGNASKVGSVSITVKDVTSPEKVTGLAVPLADAKYSALLSWAPGVDNSGKVSGYEIKLDNGKILKSSKNSLKSSKLSVGTHTYQVRAIDRDKNIGFWSDVQTFTVRDMTAPASIKAKAAVDGYSVSFVLSGKDNSGRIAKYVVTCGDKSVTTTSATAVLHDFGVGKQTALVVAYDAEGNASNAAKVSFTVKDATPPEKVTGLAVPLADAKYNALLSWAPGVDNSGKVSGYEIKLDNGKILRSSKNSLKVSKLSVGTHTYQVRAIDRDKNIGFWSDVQTFTVRDMTAPAAVSVKAKVEGNSLSLNWKTPKDNVGVTGYILKHGVNLEKTETLTASQLSFQIDAIARGSYQYQIVAVDAAGNQSKAKSGKATIRTELPMAAMSLELPDAIPSLAFDAGVSSENANAGLRHDDPLAFCSVLQTENELRLAVSDLFASDNENKPLALLAVGY